MVDELFPCGQQQVENLERGCGAVEDQGDAAGRDATAQIHLDPARLFQVARGGLPAGPRVAVEDQGRSGAVGPDAADAPAMVYGIECGIDVFANRRRADDPLGRQFDDPQGQGPLAPLGGVVEAQFLGIERSSRSERQYGAAQMSARPLHNREQR